MRVLNGLKYTAVDQFKVLAITIASVSVVFLGIIALFASSSAGIRYEAYPLFISISSIIMVFMGISYTPLYFRTLVQAGFTRTEIFIIQLITDVIILLSSIALIFLSVLPILPPEIYKIGTLYIKGDMILSSILSTLALRTLFNIAGLIINKFDSRFAAGVVGVVAYFLFGLLSRLDRNFEIATFLEEYGIIVSIVSLAIVLTTEFFIIKKHNSKPIAK